MTVLSVVKDVCYAVGVNPPTSMFAASVQPRTQAELLSLANEMAQRIAYDSRDWTALKKYATFLGDGVTTAFPMPADYKRMLLTGQVRKASSPRTPLRFVADTDEWLTRRMESASDAAAGEWTLIGEHMHVWPVLPVGDSVQFVYLDKFCIKLSAPPPPPGVNYSEVFVADDDTFRIDERLLKLGMIWQWKANKGSPYAEDVGTYGDAMQSAMGADKPAPIIVDRQPISAAVNPSYPWPVPT